MDGSKETRRRSKKYDGGLEITVNPTRQPSTSNTNRTFTEIEIMPVIEIEVEPMFDFVEVKDEPGEADMAEEANAIDLPENSESDNDYIISPSVSTETRQRGGPTEQPAEDRTVTCDECGEDFNYTLPINNKEQPLLCNTCNKQYEHEYRKVKFFSCTICKARFSKKYYLTDHIKSVHTGINRFSCDICHKKFPQKSYLNIHMKLTHLEDNAFYCKVCKKQFTEKSTLSAHERTHMGEKPFVCAVCNYQFAQKSHLNAHERLHTGERPFSCDICHKQFSKKHHLSVHATVHSGEKPYSCDICQKRFSQKSSVNVHKRRFVCVMQTRC